jgi:hypothetical protein
MECALQKVATDPDHAVWVLSTKQCWCSPGSLGFALTRLASHAQRYTAATIILLLLFHAFAICCALNACWLAS